jgi:protein TonB
VGEKRRIATAFLPAVAIHVLLVLGFGALLALGLDPEHRVLPVALLSEPEPPPEPDVKAPQADPEPVKATPKRKKKKAVQPAEIEEPSPVEEAGPSLVEEEASPPEPASSPAPQPQPVAATPPPAPSPAETVDVDAALAQIRAKLQKNLLYPPVARLNSMQGTVRVRFEVQGSGKPHNVKVVQSSGFQVLDEAAVKTVLASAPLPVVPVKVKVPVVFKLD